ncbi:MAG: VWA domain-containing protein [Vicinamibacterales bacterium]
MRHPALAAVIAAATLVTVSAQTPAPASQTQSSQLTFRSATNLVEVDVVVQDGDGRFVPGLTADDLVVLEDGRPQAIQQFYLVNNQSTSVAGPDELLPSIDVDPRGHRLFVFLFDLGHLGVESLLRSKVGVERFINTQFRKGDFGGIFAEGEMHRDRITSDKLSLLAGLHAVQPAVETRETRLQGFREYPQIPSEADAVRIDLGDDRLAESLATDLCQPGTATAEECRAEGGIGETARRITRKARNYIRDARIATGQTVAQLQLVAANLATIPGRKTVIFISDGFFIEESRAEVEQIAAMAARGGTAIYSVYGRGSSVIGGRAMPDVTTSRPTLSSTFDTSDDGPQILTAGTGGFVIRNLNDISRAINLVARDTSTYYVLGYSPTNAVMDGKVRKIEVKARTGSLHVRARNSYLASPLPPRQPLRYDGGGGQ